ncbi:hypothetical protein [Flavobacterium sp.]|uniref:hypothetical protein n=1 Tax=Flavobacterium sp. TaxID=239 RepID=UPI003D1180F1
MKKIITLLASLFILISCHDGNLIEQSFNFSKVSVQKCGSSNTLYKLNDNEALIYSTLESNFPNKEGIQNLPISATNAITYKKFSQTITSSTICDAPSISMLEQWTVSGGTVEINSTKIIDTTDPTKIIAYNHLITFKNITFNTPNGQVVYDKYDFGSHRTEVVDLKFNYDSAILQNCSGNNLLFKYNISNALLLDIDPALYKHQTIGTKTALISATNKISYRVYNGGLNANFFCQSIPPTSPSLTEEWIAEEGILDKSGIIIIETTQQTPTTYKHTIKLRNVIFKKGVLTYSPKPDGDYIFGEIIN